MGRVAPAYSPYSDQGSLPFLIIVNTLTPWFLASSGLNPTPPAWSLLQYSPLRHPIPTTSCVVPVTSCALSSHQVPQALGAVYTNRLTVGSTYLASACDLSPP